MKMHSIAPCKFKSSLLSLLAGTYSVSELKRAGFRFSPSQYYIACRKAREEKFSLANTRSVVLPSCREPATEDTINLVRDVLRRFSRESCVTVRSRIDSTSGPSNAISSSEVSFTHSNITYITVSYSICTSNPSKLILIFYLTV